MDLWILSSNIVFYIEIDCFEVALTHHLEIIVIGHTPQLLRSNFKKYC